MLIKWDDRYSTGIVDVDYEHRELIDLINTLFERVGEGEAAEKVTAFFGDLLNAVTGHFALEERLMRDRAYDGYSSHKADHEALLDSIRDIMDGYEAGAAAFTPDKLGAVLDVWFSVHFSTHDARLHKVFGSMGH
ncbi:MAG: bacteriohemerythrin [Hyphomicrobiales bacterium]|nr:bacteriohemerythrin [Hyphomicrobiales bacterium]